MKASHRGKRPKRNRATLWRRGSAEDCAINQKGWRMVIRFVPIGSRSSRAQLFGFSRMTSPFSSIAAILLSTAFFRRNGLIGGPAVAGASYPAPMDKSDGTVPLDPRGPAQQKTL